MSEAAFPSSLSGRLPKSSPGRISEDIANLLGKKLMTRSDRQELISKSIIKDTDDGQSIEDRSMQLLGMLDRRPSRGRLLRLNVIKEDAAVVSPALHAAREQLKRATKNDHLSNWLSNRPQPEFLKSRRIIVDEHEAAKLSSARSMLEDHMASRISRHSIGKNILSEEFVESPNHQAGSEAVPKRVKSIDEYTIAKCEVGWAHTLFLDDEGTILSMGSGANGHLGHGDNSNLNTPMAIESLQDIGSASQISVGMSHSAAIIDGRVYTWGEGQWGRLGLGNNEDCLEPRMVETLANFEIVEVACGSYHTLVLSKDGDVFAFGWNKGGRLGVGLQTTLVSLEEPLKLPRFSESDRVIKLAAGTMSSAALTESGVLYTWGMGSYGLLGHGSEDSYKEPHRVEALAGIRIVEISVGEYHMMALSDTADVYSWGRNDFNQLGYQQAADTVSLSPRKVTFDWGGQVTSISCGKQYSTVTAGGRLFTWGKGTSGVLGHGNFHSYDEPTAVSSLSQEKLIMTQGGWSHTITCSEEGNVFIWGKNKGHSQC